MKDKYFATLDILEKHLQEELDSILKLKNKGKRSDKGKKRGQYGSNLPANYRSYINRANKKGLSFELSLEQFNDILTMNCVYCGDSSKITIDRKDNNQGYIIDNCQPVCYRCNIMKFKSTIEDFIEHVKKISKHLNLV